MREFKEFEHFANQCWMYQSNPSFPKRKTFESDSHHKKAILETNDLSCKQIDRLYNLIDSIQYAIDFYNRNLYEYEYLNNGNPLVTFLFPDLDQHASLEEVEKLLDEFEPYYSLFAVPGYLNIYETIRSMKANLEYQLRFNFIEQAVKDATKTKPIVFIETKYEPEPSKYDQFFDELETLKKFGGYQLLRVYDLLDLEWIAFDARNISHDRIKYLAKEWHGTPSEANVYHSHLLKLN